MKRNPDFKYEKYLWEKGYKKIAGIDEAGCGPWAGPIVAAAVILPTNKRINKVNDSKLLNFKLREKLYKKIYYEALDISVAIINADEIDRIGIRKANLKVMKMALNNITVQPDYVLTDAYKLDISLPQKAIIKGDRICISIAAASIIAKVERDKLMLKIHKKYPFYGFNKHKGYGTRLHREMLRKYGPSKIHRYSFKPIKIYYER